MSRARMILFLLIVFIASSFLSSVEVYAKSDVVEIILKRWDERTEGEALEIPLYRDEELFDISQNEKSNPYLAAMNKEKLDIVKLAIGVRINDIIYQLKQQWKPFSVDRIGRFIRFMGSLGYPYVGEEYEHRIETSLIKKVLKKAFNISLNKTLYEYGNSDYGEGYVDTRLRVGSAYSYIFSPFGEGREVSFLPLLRNIREKGDYILLDAYGFHGTYVFPGDIVEDEFYRENIDVEGPYSVLLKKENGDLSIVKVSSDHLEFDYVKSKYKINLNEDFINEKGKKAIKNAKAEDFVKVFR